MPTETEILAAIDQVVKVLAPRFVFAGVDVDDVAQEGRMEAWRCMARYDPRPDADGNPTRPLDGFLYRCVSNRLIRYKKDLFSRTDAPCPACRDGQTHERSRRCDVYDKWRKRNGRKASLRRTADFDGIQERQQPATRDVGDDVATKELLDKIDTKLPVELRSAYLAMRAGVRVQKSLRVAVAKAVAEILGTSYPATS